MNKSTSQPPLLVIGSFSSLLRQPMVRYFIASILALVLDTAVFSTSLRLLHIGLFWSATLGFVAGAVLAYVSSITWVFKERRLEHQPTLEFSLFVGIGVLGLGITQAVLWIGVTYLHLWPEAIKLVAAAVTFVCNYLLRRLLLFVKCTSFPLSTLSKDNMINRKNIT